jgi:hypothetical protein
MVIKSRSSHVNNLILPLVNDQEEMCAIYSVKTAQHQKIRSETRYLSIGEKDVSLLPSWNQSYGDASLSLTRNQMVLTMKRKRADPLAMVVVCVLMLGAFFHNALSSSSMKIQKEIDATLMIGRQAKVELRALEKDVLILNREVAAIQSLIQTRQRELGDDGMKNRIGIIKALEDAKVALEKMRNQVSLYTEERDLLIHSAQSRSRSQIEEKFGVGKSIRVEMSLRFPDGDAGPSKFTIQMASVDIMPFSVYTFLRMIEEGLWNGSSFVMHAKHMLKVEPVPYDSRFSASSIQDAFLEKNLSGPIFMEYDPASMCTPKKMVKVSKESLLLPQLWRVSIRLCALIESQSKVEFGLKVLLALSPPKLLCRRNLVFFNSFFSNHTLS